MPENTPAAIARAAECGADLGKFGVQHSADGVPIVFHGPELSRTTNGEGPPQARLGAWGRLPGLPSCLGTSAHLYSITAMTLTSLRAGLASTSGTSSSATRRLMSGATCNRPAAKSASALPCVCGLTNEPRSVISRR